MHLSLVKMKLYFIGCRKPAMCIIFQIVERFIVVNGFFKWFLFQSRDHINCNKANVTNKNKSKTRALLHSVFSIMILAEMNHLSFFHLETVLLPFSPLDI